MIRVGLLQCDDLDPPHRDLEGGYVEQFTRLLATGGLAAADVDLRVFRVDHGEHPGAASECDGWVITGSRAGVYEQHDWIPPLVGLVRSAIEERVPTVGVCFGHQLVAHALGAPVSQFADGWNIGALEYRVCAPPPGDPDLSPFRLVAIHQDQVHAVPEGLSLLATGDTCAVAGMVGPGVLTVQGHPEFGPAVAESLYRRRARHFGDAAVERAVTSLEESLSTGRVASWMVTTLTGSG
ncbi:MAG: type 1 glutamine amidotransferase [Ilumatobacteraceae bacterium]